MSEVMFPIETNSFYQVFFLQVIEKNAEIIHRENKNERRDRITLPDASCGFNFTSGSAVDKDGVLNTSNTNFNPITPFLWEAFLLQYKIDESLVYFIKSLFDVKLEHISFCLFLLLEIHRFICNQNGIRNLPPSDES